MMQAVLLAHWNAAETEAQAEALRAAGFQVIVHSRQSIEVMRAWRDDPPLAFAISLERMPSQGQDLALWIRQQKALRAAPLVFVGGSPEKVEKLRGLLPDALFTGWERLPETLREAMERPPAVATAAPGTMAGYSGTPLPKKLGLKDGVRASLWNSPRDFPALLQPLPAGTLLLGPGDPAEVIVLFSHSLAGLESDFPDAAITLVPGGRLWIAWPKKASGIVSDLSETVVRQFGLARGFVDYKISAFDATWSGLCFARRKGPDNDSG